MLNHTMFQRRGNIYQEHSLDKNLDSTFFFFFLGLYFFWTFFPGTFCPDQVALFFQFIFRDSSGERKQNKTPKPNSTIHVLLTFVKQGCKSIQSSVTQTLRLGFQSSPLTDWGCPWVKHLLSLFRFLISRMDTMPKTTWWSFCEDGTSLSVLHAQHQSCQHGESVSTWGDHEARSIAAVLIDHTVWFWAEVRKEFKKDSERKEALIYAL